MEPLILLLIVLLVLTAFLGGGLSIREFKLPKANTGVRIAAILSSLILWIVGSAFGQPKRASFSVTNNLAKSEGVIEERVTITIQGEQIGEITSTNRAPVSTEELTVPNAGEYSYSMVLYGTFYNKNGRETFFRWEGNGTINVQPGDTFEVQRGENPFNNQVYITLVKK